MFHDFAERTKYNYLVLIDDEAYLVKLRDEEISEDLTFELKGDTFHILGATMGKQILLVGYKGSKDTAAANIWFRLNTCATNA